MLTSAAIIAILGFGYMALRDVLTRQRNREERRQRFRRIVRENEIDLDRAGEDS